MPRWPEQFARVERCLERIHAPDRSKLDPTEHEDDLWTFFQQCWHLKDWIRTDPDLAGSVNPSDLDQALERSYSLRLAGRLATRAQGVDLVQSRRESQLVSAQTAISLREVLGRGEDPPEGEWDWKIVVPDGPDRWALEVAREAVDDWRWIVAELELNE